MAKKRPVGNLLALAVLSALAQRPMHPYEMATVLRGRGKDTDMPIKWGSLYTVVGNLERHGLIAEAGSGREGGRPERTIYRITEAGTAEMRDWVRELVATPEPELPRFKAALSVLGALRPQEVIPLLRTRLEALRGRLEERRLELARQAEQLPRLFLVEEEYELAIWQAEADWVAGLLQELTDGTFPGLDGWIAYHDTGQVPPELTDR